MSVQTRTFNVCTGTHADQMTGRVCAYSTLFSRDIADKRHVCAESLTSCCRREQVVDAPAARPRACIIVEHRRPAMPWRSNGDYNDTAPAAPSVLRRHGRDSSTYLSGSAVVQRTRDLESMGQHVRRSVAGAKERRGRSATSGSLPSSSTAGRSPPRHWNRHGKGR